MLSRQRGSVIYTLSASASDVHPAYLLGELRCAQPGHSDGRLCRREPPSESAFEIVLNLGINTGTVSRFMVPMSEGVSG